MSFLAPLAFLFALSIPVVVVFYLLKRKRVVKLVSSTLLWQKYLAETQASSPFQKLRKNWLLLLQILMLLLAVLALSRPYFSGQADHTRLQVIVLDGSASMQSTDVEPSRFEQAKSEALAWVDGLRDGEQMMVLLAGATTEVKQSPTGNKVALRRAIRSCEPSDAPTRLAEALKTAAAFTFEKRGEESVTTGEIHLFSDGAANDLDQVANQNLPLVYHKVGQGGDNLGLVALDVKANPENAQERAIFAAVANTGTNRLTSDIELLFEGTLLERRALDIGPTNTEPLVFFAPQDHDGVFTLRLTGTDALAVDNEAVILSRLPQPMKVILVTRGNRFLEKALRGVPGVELTVAPRLNDAAENFDLAVLDDVLPIVWPAVHTLALNTTSTNWFPAGWSRTEAPPIVDWKSTHPLLRFVNFDNIQVAEALVVQPPGWGVPLVESPETPLIIAGEIDQHRLVWVGFDVLQSTWPLRIAFPIFIANAVDWMNPANINASRQMVQAGNPYQLNLLQPVSEATVTLPDGTREDLALAGETRELIFGKTFAQGIYTVQAGTNMTQFCVNLLDANETAIMPRDALPFGEFESVEATTIKRANVEIWRWIALLALAVLLFEWWYYHKRTA